MRRPPIHEKLSHREHSCTSPRAGTADSSYHQHRSQNRLCLDYLSEHHTTEIMPQAQPELKKVSAPRKLKVPQPNLKKYLEKRILVQLNGSRKVMGILRGYDVRTPCPECL